MLNLSSLRNAYRLIFDWMAHYWEKEIISHVIFFCCKILEVPKPMSQCFWAGINCRYSCLWSNMAAPGAVWSRAAAFRSSSSNRIHRWQRVLFLFVISIFFHFNSSIKFINLASCIILKGDSPRKISSCKWEISSSEHHHEHSCIEICL